MKLDNAFIRALTILARSFRQEVDELFLEAYALGLDRLTDDELEIAVKMAIHSCRFMPSPVELAEFVGKEPDVALMRPASRCRACQRQLDFQDSRERGFCVDCWRRKLEARSARQVDRKQIEGGSNE